MSETMNFRSAFHGFNREDVVRYIEYLNAKHASELSQLRAELESSQGVVTLSGETNPWKQQLEEQARTISRLQDQLAHNAMDDPHSPEEWDANIDARIQAEFDRDAALEAQAQAEAERDAALEAQRLAEADRDAALAANAQSAAAAATQQNLYMEELEAYRRAERTERLAKERASRIYHLVDTALAGATSRVEETFSQIDQLTGMVTQQLDNLQTAVTDSKQALADATATLSQIRTEEDT